MSATPAIALSATFTAEPVQEILEFWSELLELGFEVKFAPYNQVFQQLLDPASLLARNRNGVNVVLTRFEDWARFQKSIDLKRLEDNVRHLVSCVSAAAGASAAPLIVCVCPDSPRFLAERGHAAFVKAMEEHITASLAPLATVHVITPAQIDALYPVPDYYDAHGDDLGHVPYTPEFYAALATSLARKIAALRREPYKVIAVDCDDTLWRGICGEDGPAGAVLDAPRRALQDFLRGQRASGVLLAIASKNNEDDVLETFRAHPEMPLRPEDFTAMRIDWEPKSENLARLAEDLQFGLDSFIFLDDSPQECAAVQASAPEVLTLPLPRDTAEIPEFLEHVWAFDRTRITAEDRSRTHFYAQQAERARMERQAGSIEEFVASLQLDVRISPLVPEHVARVAQLTQRTNQMNTTTVRRTEAEVQSALAEGAECVTVEVTDRFGSYGISGAIIFHAAREALVADSFLLSCRALGRGVEHRMLAHLGRLAVSRGAGAVEVPLISSQRNRPARQFLESCGEHFAQPQGAGVVFCFPAAFAASVSYRPGSTARTAPAVIPRAQEPRNRPDYLRIAAELRRPDQILEAARSRNQAARVKPIAPEPPRTELEAQLAELWASMLGLASVGIHQSFFDLGGHSLLAVQLLSRVRQEFGADLSLEVVYDDAFTVAALAEAIETQQIERELEGLTEEEVRALLSGEDANADQPG